MSEQTYWTGRRIGRRAALRGAGVGIAGLAGAALIGCGGEEEATATATAAGGAATPTAATGETGGGPVSADQVRIPSGRYEGFIAPTAAEQDPLTNARYGGTLKARYLDPPHMDFNRTLSCTVNTTMDYTNSKLTRAKFGAHADPKRRAIEPDLAESWEVNGDATEFTFHLRPGVKFHNVAPVNGRELTSEDVRLSYERYKAGGTQQDVFLEVKSFEAPDDYTLKVNLTQPLIDFPRNIASWSFIWPRELVEDPDVLAEHAIGTGAFIQEEWTRKERSVFAKNPEYFEQGLPFLDRVEAYVMNDTAAIRAAYLTDNIVDWGARDETDADDMHSKTTDSVEMNYEGLQGANSQVFTFQMKNPIVQDVRVRRAVNMAWDRLGYATAQGYVSDGFSKPSISWQELFDERPTLADQGPWFQYNQAEASKLLQAAGYSATSPLTFDVSSWYLSGAAPQRYGFEDIIVPDMNQVPELNIGHRTVDNPTSVVMLNERNFEVAHGMTFGPPAYSVDQWLYPFYHSNGGLNFGNRNEPALDQLLEAQRSELDPEAQHELWIEIWNMQHDQIWDVFFPTNTLSRGFWHNYVLGYRPFPSGLSCYGNSQLRSVWLDEGAPNT